MRTLLMTASPLKDEGVSGAEIWLQPRLLVSIAGVSASAERAPVSQTAIALCALGFESESAPSAAPACHPNGITVASNKMIRIRFFAFGKHRVFMESFFRKEFFRACSV